MEINYNLILKYLGNKKTEETFSSLKNIMVTELMEYIQVYEPFEFAAPLPGIRQITYKELLNQIQQNMSQLFYILDEY